MRGLATAGEARVVAEFQRECYHIGTVPVKEKLEVIGGAGVRGGRMEQVKMGNRN
jgi:hypothetical protein